MNMYFVFGIVKKGLKVCSCLVVVVGAVSDGRPCVGIAHTVNKCVSGLHQEEMRAAFPSRSADTLMLMLCHIHTNTNMRNAEAYKLYKIINIQNFMQFAHLRH